MTLETFEGTKAAAGTDLHSKTASILGISRDHCSTTHSQTYGTGMRNAVLLHSPMPVCCPIKSTPRRKFVRVT
ncbi:hypothetical protein BDR03DRAFT_954856 [Suillus americanus]|nr:hypothetical protein BDR03DRAFT_954856 [Suillus americanus]